MRALTHTIDGVDEDEPPLKPLLLHRGLMDDSDLRIVPVRHRSPTAVDRYSDETTTGRIFKGHGGRPKATIAARAESTDGFEWFAAWRRDYGPGPAEVKSSTALQIAARDKAAEARLCQGLASCPIFIVDLAENTRRLMGPIRQWLPETVPDDIDILEVANNPKTHHDAALGLLMTIRELEIGSSAFGAIESLMSDDGGIGAALRKAGLGDYAPLNRHEFDRAKLLKLPPKEFHTLAGRFAAAIGDALSPGAQIRAITEGLGDSRYLGMGHIAHRVLREATEHDTIFDVAGSHRVTKALEHAHAEVVDFLERSQWREVTRTLSAGAVKEEDSKHLLGIQVADLAAGFAAEMYERSGLGSLDAARFLLRRFDRVFLNDRWLR